ncbi:MAG: hypothetical protein JOZ19_06520 [Rubrobacter sp.]|nr:hypothetical protein [Rubrobacter sp.]
MGAVRAHLTDLVDLFASAAASLDQEEAAPHEEKAVSRGRSLDMGSRRFPVTKI